MHDTWYVLKWVCVAVTFAYLIVQLFAIRRLRGDQRRHSNGVLTVVLIVMFASDTIRNVFFFENRIANRVGTVTVAVVALVATFVLARIFGESPTGASGNQQDDQSYVQPLKLS